MSSAATGRATCEDEYKYSSLQTVSNDEQRNCGREANARNRPWHCSKDNQIGLLFVVSNDGILHVTAGAHIRSNPKSFSKITNLQWLLQNSVDCIAFKCIVFIPTSVIELVNLHDSLQYFLWVRVKQSVNIMATSGSYFLYMKKRHYNSKSIMSLCINEKPMKPMGYQSAIWNLISCSKIGQGSLIKPTTY